jgi:general stress protein YciG
MRLSDWSSSATLRYMPTSKRKDFTQTALDVVRQATGEVTAPTPSKKQESGRKGGLKGGASRAINLTPEQRSDIARVAAQARWKKA